MRDETTDLLIEVGRHYSLKDKADFEIYQLSDVHAYYRLTRDPKKVIHVHVWPNSCVERGMLVSANLMDYQKMLEIRLRDKDSVGMEFRAVIKRLNIFGNIPVIPFSANALEAKLEEAVPELS